MIGRPADGILAFKASHFITPSHMHEIHQSHFHDFYEIYFFLGKEMHYFLENKIIHLKKNDIVIINKYIYHKTSYMKNVDSLRINLNFTDNDLDLLKGQECYSEIIHFLEESKHIDGYYVDSQALYNSLEQIVALCAIKDPEPEIIYQKRALLINVIFIALHASKRNRKTEQSRNENNDITQKLIRITNSINYSFRHDLTLDGLSMEYKVSKYYLCRKFKEFTGIGLTEFINNKRIDEAEKLLENTNYTITKICELIGLQNLTYFNKLFKNKNDMTPGEYRRRLKSS